MPEDDTEIAARGIACEFTDHLGRAAADPGGIDAKIAAPMA